MSDPKTPPAPAIDSTTRVPSPGRLRVLGTAALVLAIAWCTAATWISLSYIRDLEIAAGMALFLSHSMGGGSPETPFNPIVVVATRLIWLAVMYLVAFGTAFAAVWGLRAKRAARWLLRFAGVAILLAAGATFAGIETLIHWGGFPPLPAHTIALICICQALPGLALLATTRKHSYADKAISAP